MSRDISPLEDQYGKEFYRCIGDVLKGRMTLSPELRLVTELKAAASIFSYRI
jgi:hypothetical protein